MKASPYTDGGSVQDSVQELSIHAGYNASLFDGFESYREVLLP